MTTTHRQDKHLAHRCFSARKLPNPVNLSMPFPGLLLAGLLPVRILRGCRIVLAFAALGGLAACVDRPKTPAASSIAPEEQHAPANSVSVAEAQEIKREAFSQLLPLIRRFDRKKTAYEISEKEYLEKLYFWTLTFSMLELRSNPGTFAGDLPEHEAFAFSDFAESAENLLGDLQVYLKRYADESDPEYNMLLRKKEEAGAAVLLNFPGTGSRLQDAIVAMHSAEFQKVVNVSNSKIADLGVIGGKHLMETFNFAAGKTLNFLNTLFQTQGKSSH